MIVTTNNPIVMQHPDDPNKWILVEDYHYVEDNEQKCIPRGFVHDFASIPRLFWNIIAPTELGDVGPIKHDWTYRNGEGTRVKRDKVFLEDMRIDGISWWKRTAAYRLVRLFGGSSWNSGNVVIEKLEEVAT